MRAEKILHRIRETRSGKLYDSRFYTRGRGEGHYADAIAHAFDVTIRRLGFNRHDAWKDVRTFQRPTPTSPQLSFF
jgi:hypothetical protein